jgi:hypothetical protein
MDKLVPESAAEFMFVLMLPRCGPQVDVTFQNLDSSEISLSDVSHYFDSDPTKVYNFNVLSGLFSLVHNCA